MAPLEAELRGQELRRLPLAAFLLAVLAGALLWTGWPLYAAAAVLLFGRLDAPLALIVAPALYGLTLLLGTALAPLLAMALLGRGEQPRAAEPEGARGLRRLRIADLGQRLARVLLASPAFRPAVLVSESAARALEPAALDALVRIEEERRRLGYPRRRLVLRLIASVLGPVALLSAWARFLAPPPFPAFFLLPPLLDAWLLLLGLPFLARERAAADRAAVQALGVERVRAALLAAHALESPAASAPTPTLERRLASLERPGRLPLGATPAALALAALASLAVAAVLARLALGPTEQDLGTAALAEGDSGAAERHLREFVRQHPGDATAASELAWALADLGRDQEAREWGDRAVGLAPGDVDVAEERSRLEEFLGLRSMAGAPPMPGATPPAP